MSICIAISVPDGIALAADSQTTWNQTITNVREKGTGREVALEQPLNVPISWSRMTRKLFPIKVGKKHYAACVAGAALINRKTIFSIFKSLEANYPNPDNATFDSVAEYFCNGLAEQIKKEFGVEDVAAAAAGFMVDFILAGFDEDDVSKPRIERWAVFTGSIEAEATDGAKTIATERHKAWSNLNGSMYAFGGCWVGRTDFISHIVTHKNAALPPIQGQFELLSLSDAVDYTKFLVNFTCDFQRFAIMVPDCGKPIISATLTPDGYKEEIVLD